MTFEFLTPAAVEYLAAYDWYDERSARAAERFHEVVNAAVQRAMERPTSAGFLIGKRVRKIVLKPFDYGLLYFAHNHVIYVVAVAHNKRRPDYWRDRLTWS